mmetsp:Transcript_31844/g.48458  ORF Transcript_31844/g.48458 Transcript_31844/m.48458 type:complete len:114 (+) Transcript_31844:36-377(+)
MQLYYNYHISDYIFIRPSPFGVAELFFVYLFRRSYCSPYDMVPFLLNFDRNGFFLLLASSAAAAAFFFLETTKNAIPTTARTAKAAIPHPNHEFELLSRCRNPDPSADFKLSK